MPLDGDGSESIEVPYTRIEWVRRRAAGKASPGDRARLRLEPGMIRLLESLGAAGAFYAPRYTVPYGLGGSVVHALVDVAAPEGGNWTGRDVELEYFATPEPAEVLVAEGELAEIDAGLADVRFRVWTLAGRPLLNGRVRVSGIVGGRPLATALLRPAPQRVGPAALIDSSRLLADIQAPAALNRGRTGRVAVTLSNPTDQPVTVTVSAHLPSGAGLSLDSDSSVRVEMAPRERTEVVFLVRADRPHEVNQGRPWTLTFRARADGLADRAEDTCSITVAVPDEKPGRVFYVLTEDCETFDGGPRTGDYAALSHLGNGNNFMDPEDYRIQMIDKPARMNEVAERHGARWTHFWCAPQRFAVEWAMRQSTTGAWDALARDLDDSIRRGATFHEYAPHIHFDYEPESQLSPQPRLRYDEATDGILPNDYYDPATNPRHRWHDWDGAARGNSYIKRLGTLRDRDSKAGSLYQSLRYLARLTAHRRYPLIARTGTFDFGATPEDQCISTQAYEANGLRGNSDAYLPGQTPPGGRQMYWCQAEDRFHVIEELPGARLAQLCVTHDTHFTELGAENAWFLSAWENTRGPGVHVLMTMTHAMFLRGEPDAFRSLEGGSFAVLDEHLAWVRRNYPRVEFATATEALVEYLDYYTPALEAYVEPGLCGGDPSSGRYVYAVRLLGRGIRVDARYPATVRVLAPQLFDSAEIARMRVTAACGEVLAEGTDFSADSRPSLTVTLTDRRPDLRLEIDAAQEAVAELAACCPEELPFTEPYEAQRPPLLRLRSPRDGAYFTDLLRFLMNPAGGHGEPVGRRLHPLGSYGIGISLSLAAAQAGIAMEPRRLFLRWRKPLSLDATLFASFHSAADGAYEIFLEDETGTVIAESRVWAGEKTARRERAGGPDPGYRFAAALEERLRVYRSQRAWRVMLWVRKAYSIATRQGWIAFVRWLPGALTGRGDIDSEELTFPRWEDHQA